jgi:hypothetical protein
MSYQSTLSAFRRLEEQGHGSVPAQLRFRMRSDWRNQVQTFTTSSSVLHILQKVVCGVLILRVRESGTLDAGGRSCCFVEVSGDAGPLLWFHSTLAASWSPIWPRWTEVGKL